MLVPYPKKVWINGTFDVLHLGHLRMFEFASKFGELHVGVDSDERVKLLKGESRPFNSLSDRIEFLKNIKNIHNVYSFGSDESLENLMQSLNPDYMIIGSDYKGKKIIGSQYVKEIIFFERIEEYSTTKILNNENISNRRTL